MRSRHFSTNIINKTPSLHTDIHESFYTPGTICKLYSTDQNDSNTENRSNNNL